MKTYKTSMREELINTTFYNRNSETPRWVIGLKVDSFIATIFRDRTSADDWNKTHDGKMDNKTS